MRLLVAMVIHLRMRMARLLRLTGDWSRIPPSWSGIRDTVLRAMWLVELLKGDFSLGAATMEYLILVWSILQSGQFTPWNAATADCRDLHNTFKVPEYKLFTKQSLEIPSHTYLYLVSPVPQSQESVFFVPCQCLIIEVQIVNYTPSCIMGQKIRKNAAASAPSILCSLSSHSWENIRFLYFLHDILDFYDKYGSARGWCDLDASIPQGAGYRIPKRQYESISIVLFLFV